MLHELGIENFKPFGSPAQVAPFSKINLIYGPNSGGKSSIIQTLMLLRQTFEGDTLWSSGLIARGEYVDLGSFRSLIHRHDVGGVLGLSLAYDRVALPGRFVPSLPRDEARRISLFFAAPKKKASKDSSQLVKVRYELERGDLLDATFLRAGEQQSLFDTGEAALARGVFQWASEAARRSYAQYLRHFEAKRGEGRASRSRLLSAGVHTPSDASDVDVEKTSRLLARTVATTWRRLPARLVPSSTEEVEEPNVHRFSSSRPLESLAGEFPLLLNSLVYLGPLRSHPARHYLVTGAATDTVGVRGENTPQVIYRSPTGISKDINAWLSRMDIPYRMKVKSIGDELTGEIIAMHLTDPRTKLQVGPSDVGFGIGQLLPIIVQGLVSPGRTVCVEQPEIHLHPKLQAHVADFLIHTAGAGSSRAVGGRGPRTQWIVETHSEALVLRLQRRIREGFLKAEDVSILYVQPTDEGRSRILRLRLADDGRFVDEWPAGFFEERFEEMFTEQDS